MYMPFASKAARIIGTARYGGGRELDGTVGQMRVGLARLVDIAPAGYTGRSGCLAIPTVKSLAMSIQALALPYYEQILEFLAAGPSAQEIIAFRPQPEVQERFSQLLEVNRQRDLTSQEEEELDHYIRIERMLALLKAKAYHHCNRP